MVQTIICPHCQKGMKVYINALLEKGLEVSQMDHLFKAVGMDMEIHVHELEE